MKKFLLPLMAMLVSMVACQKDNEGILKLEVEEYNTDAKLHLNSDDYAVWDNGDEVMVNGADYTVSVSGTSATLTGVTEAATYTAIYPADWAGGTTSNPTITYPETQTYSATSIDAPMAAFSDGNNLSFKNLGSILAVNVSGVTKVQKIEVIADGNTAINGAAPLNTTGDRPTLGTLTGGTSTTTLKCNGVTVPTTGMTFYIALPSVTANLTIKVYDDYYCYSRSQDRTTPPTYEANHGYNVPFDATDATQKQYAPMSNQIMYVTSDGNPLVGYSTYDESSCNPVGKSWISLGLCTSNVYDGSYGFITFEEPITTIEMTYDDSYEYKLFCDNDCYGDNRHITDIYLPEGVTTLDEFAFSCNTYTGTISLPSTLTTINAGALKNNVTRLEIHSTTPPALNGHSAYYQNFNNTNLILHVPAGSGAAYASSTSPWSPYFGTTYGPGTRIVDDL